MSIQGKLLLLFEVDKKLHQMLTYTQGHLYGRNYFIHSDRFPPIIPAGEYYLYHSLHMKRKSKTITLAKYRIFVDIVAKGIAVF